MVDHLQSHVTPWRQYAIHVKVRGTLSKMDVIHVHALSVEWNRDTPCRSFRRNIGVLITTNFEPVNMFQSSNS